MLHGGRCLVCSVILSVLLLLLLLLLWWGCIETGAGTVALKEVEGRIIEASHHVVTSSIPSIRGYWLLLVLLGGSSEHRVQPSSVLLSRGILRGEVNVLPICRKV